MRVLKSPKKCHTENRGCLAYLQVALPSTKYSCWIMNPMPSAEVFLLAYQSSRMSSNQHIPTWLYLVLPSDLHSRVHHTHYEYP